MGYGAWWSQSGPPWYIVTIISGIVGVIIAKTDYALSYPIRRVRKDKYIGQWYEYHWTWVNGSKELWSAQLHVRHGVRSRYIVSANHLRPSNSSNMESQSSSYASSQAETLKYSGDLRTEGGHVILTLRAKTHQESLFYRFRDWTPSSSDRIIGLWLSYDHSGSPAAGSALLSGRPLTDDDAVRLIQGSFTSSRGLLRVKDGLQK